MSTPQGAPHARVQALERLTGWRLWTESYALPESRMSVSDCFWPDWEPLRHRIMYTSTSDLRYRMVPLGASVSLYGTMPAFARILFTVLRAIRHRSASSRRLINSSSHRCLGCRFCRCAMAVCPCVGPHSISIKSRVTRTRFFKIFQYHGLRPQDA